MNREPEIFRTLNWKEIFLNVSIDIEVSVKISPFGLAK
jgi:hypothetical protein